MNTVKRLLGYKCNTEMEIEQQCQGKITITNLENTFDKKEIMDAFKPFGNILSCEIEKGKDNESIETVYIIFENEKDAENAINKMNGQKIKQNVIGVKIYEKPKTLSREVKFPSKYTIPKQDVVDSTDDDDDDLD